LMLIDVSGRGKPRMLPDGRVDHHDLQTVINIRKGTPLVRRTPPAPGKEGISVFGSVLKPPPVHDWVFKIGKGTEVAKDNPNLVVAAIEGALALSPDGTVEVHTEKSIPSDIDYSTGNLSFSGDLKINGTVRAGFKIAADGNVLIRGGVEDAEVSCSGNLEILGGARGAAHGFLTCKGTLKVRHIENFSASAQNDIIIMEDAIHSTLTAGKNISVKSLLGGRVSAGDTLTAETIGGSAEIHTTVDIGRIFKLRQKTIALSAERATLENELRSTNDAIYELVQGGMDGAGVLDAGALARLNAIKQNKQKTRERLSTIALELGEVEKDLKQQANPVVKARTVFRGTVVVLGETERTIDEKMTNVVITADDAGIVVR
ncbi:MAG: FapA family protein, partial [Chitinivibrionales bacterium]|nr:FapA family protein [Chitinivibrionales bacterium]